MTLPNHVDERLAASGYSRSLPGTSRDERPVAFVACANDRVDGVRYLRDLASELRAIRSAFAPLTASGQWELVERGNATLDDILDVFQSEVYRDRIAVFHYAGHADGYRLLLETERGSLTPALAKGLSAFLGRQRGLQLVVLNGCATEDQAQSLLAAGVHSVIATSSEIVDKVARVFATRLYRGLATGADLGRAFDESVAAIRSTPATRRHLEAPLQSGIRRQDPPWALFPDAAESSSWTLGDITGDPLLGIPTAETADLPDTPFLNLLPFESEHTELFFGRGRDIRRLYNALIDRRSDPIHLLCGQTGVGKSSILAAGLLPRLELRKRQKVIYCRRHESLGLLWTLANALDCEQSSIASEWRKREKGNCVLTVVLDQAEEAFTRQHSTEGEAELRTLCTELRSLFLNPASRPGGKLLLAFRKEHLADINARFVEAQLPRTAHFLERLDRAGIIEAITGPSRNQRLRDKYQLTLEPRLAEIIADDLQEDSGSNIAPVLQILLAQMWERAERQGDIPRRFDRATYQELKAKGLLLHDFLDQQIAALHEWRADLVESGFVWDFLCAHTTDFGSARSRTDDELQEDYPHQRAWRALRAKAVELYLLVESHPKSREGSSADHSARLAHDTLAPLVRQRFAESVADGQKARRILENRAPDWAGSRSGAVLDEADLTQVERGALGMRAWRPEEERLVAASREAREDRERRRRRSRLVYIAGAATIVLVSFIAFIQYLGRDRQRRIALASSLATQAEASLRTGKLLTQSVLLGAEAMRRLVELKQPTLDADRALRAGFALAVPGDSAIRLASHVGAAALSEGAKLAALADADSVHVGSVGSRGQTLAFHSTRSYLVVLSPDGRRIAAAGSDTTLELWDVATRTRLARPQITRPVQGLAWSAATGSLAVLLAGADTIELWHGTDGAVTKKFPHGGVVNQFAMSSEGDHLATIVDSTLTVWSTSSGHLGSVGLPNGLTHVLFDPSGRCVVAASGPKGQAWIWDVSKRALVSQLATARDVVEVSVDPTCTRIAFGSTTGDIQIVDWRTRRTVAGMTHDARIATLSFSADGSRLLSGSGDHTARVWRVSDGTEIARMVHDAAVLSAGFLDDSTVVAASEDGQMRVWHLRSSAYRWRRELREPIASAQVSPDGATIASGTQYGVVRLSSLSGAWPDTVFSYGAPITALRFLPDSKTLIVAGLAGAQRLDVKTLTTSARWKGVVTSLAVGKTGDLVMGRDDGSVVLSRRGHPDSIVSTRTNDQVRAIAWSRDGRLLVWANQRSIRLRGIIETATLLDTTVASAVNALDFEPSGRAFAAALEDSTVVILSLPNGNRVMTLRHPQGVAMAAYSRDGAYLATGGRDGVARVWAVTSGQEVSRIANGSPVESVAFSDNGALLVTGTADGRITVWQWRPADLRKAACNFVGRARLSREEWQRFAGESESPPTCEVESR